MRMSMIGLAAVVMVAAGGGCATPPMLTIKGTPMAPAAIAHLSYQRDQNRNTQVDLRVDHLAPPPKIDPSLTTYVVWVAPIFGGQYEPRGALQVDQNRSGAIRFITPLDRFKVVVTAENNPMVHQPGPRVVMQGMVDATRGR